MAASAFVATANQDEAAPGATQGNLIYIVCFALFTYSSTYVLLDTDYGFVKMTYSEALAVDPPVEPKSSSTGFNFGSINYELAAEAEAAAFASGSNVVALDKGLEREGSAFDGGGGDDGGGDDDGDGLYVEDDSEAGGPRRDAIEDRGSSSFPNTRQ